MRAFVPPLVLAARAGDVAGLLALIEQGHAVDGTDPGGVTPLIAAAAAGNGEVLQWLDAAGARSGGARRDDRGRARARRRDRHGPRHPPALHPRQ